MGISSLRPSSLRSFSTISLSGGMVAVGTEGVDRVDVADHRRPVERPVHLITAKAVALGATAGDVANLIATSLAVTRLELEARRHIGEGRRRHLLDRLGASALRKVDVELIRIALTRLAVVL